MSKWVDDIFAAGMVNKDGMVRRSIEWIRKRNVEEEIKTKCREREYHIFEHGDQWIILCNPNLRMIV